MWIERGGDLQQRSQEIEMLGALVMSAAEVLHGAGPVNISQQAVVAKAHFFQCLGR